MFKSKNKLILILVLFTVIFSIYFIRINDVKAEETNVPKKGDLRCPISAKNCELTSDGKEVIITTIKNDITIQKHVEKTEMLGRYKVWFTINGNLVPPTNSNQNVYIVVTLDMSYTMSTGNNFKDAIDAINDFLSEISKSAEATGVNYKISFLQFAKNSAWFDIHTTSTKLFSYVGYNKEVRFLDEGVTLGTTSHLESAYTQINYLFNNNSHENEKFLRRVIKDKRNLAKNTLIEENAKKYVVLFGDGRYWQGTGCEISKAPNDTNCNDLKKQLTNLKSKNVLIYGIRYDGKLYDKYYTPDDAEGKCGAKKGKSPRYMDCDTLYMKANISGDEYYEYASQGNYKNIFTNIAKKIIQDNPKIEQVSLTLTDSVGEKFNISGNYSNTLEFKVDFSNGKKEYKTDPFEIVIDENRVEEEYKNNVKYRDDDQYHWHETNKSHGLRNDSNNTPIITSSVNPQVYWPPEYLDSSCAQTVEKEKINVNQDTSIYKESCTEIYKAEMAINNLENGVKHFDIKNGIGFPAFVNVTTTLKCTYEFDKTKYDEAIRNAEELKSDKKEGEVLSKNAYDELNTKLEKYVSFTEDPFSTYIKDFYDNENNEVKLYIEYNDIRTSNNFINNINNKDNAIEEAKSKIECIDTATTTIKLNTGEESEIKNRICSVTLSKEMQLPNVCLNMVTGEKSSSCSDSNKLINGGNNFYVDLSKIKQKNIKGRVGIEISNAGYFGNIKISLNGGEEIGDDCTFSGSKDLGIQYRQISLSDPFNQKYGKNPGRNYSNANYNFVKIIKNDLWNDSNNFNYRFQLSKTNVKNIISDTKEDNNSYLGKNCHFTSNNKYVCDFIRDQNSRINFFTKVELK